LTPEGVEWCQVASVAGFDEMLVGLVNILRAVASKSQPYSVSAGWLLPRADAADEIDRVKHDANPAGQQRLHVGLVLGPGGDINAQESVKRQRGCHDNDSKCIESGCHVSS
jgi:hypothetical protein